MRAIPALQSSGARPVGHWQSRAFAARTHRPSGPGCRRHSLAVYASADVPQESSTPTVDSPIDPTPETVFYEGSGAPAELGLSLLLAATLVYIPLTMASIGRRLWINYKFTNKRLVVTTNSPIVKREVQVRKLERQAWGDRQSGMT
jgi:hypothetical protein